MVSNRTAERIADDLRIGRGLAHQSREGKLRLDRERGGMGLGWDWPHYRPLYLRFPSGSPGAARWPSSRHCRTGSKPDALPTHAFQQFARRSVELLR